ncbi:UNVERIFIED_CONTAM: hypothetical protein PYX00_002541 [Menopon gallinae]|uniref:Uncharacterized protein n=1 Tax=Menopon gallinae TaxID=328185 RepID=A0AAW2IJ92_9NEOP
MTTLENEKIVRYLGNYESVPIVNDVPFHPSECVKKNLNIKPVTKNSLKIDLQDITFINNYHFYCRLCQQHFYSFSNINDINSYFQPHLNTADHIWNKSNGKYDFNKAMIVWEKWLVSGTCQICRKSDIDAFIIDTKLELADILEEHLMGTNHTDKYLVVHCKPWNRIFPTLAVVCKKYIAHLPNDVYVCVVCFKRMETPGLVKYHIISASHAEKLEALLKNKMDIRSEDITEADVKILMNWITMKRSAQISPSSDFKNLEENPETQFKQLSLRELGFSPREMEKFLVEEGNDYYVDNFCLLCKENMVDLNSHMLSNSHQLRRMVFERCAAVQPVAHPEYIKNREKRLSEHKDRIALYNKYKSALKEHNLDFGVPFKSEYSNLNLRIGEAVDENAEPIKSVQENEKENSECIRKSEEANNITRNKLEGVNKKTQTSDKIIIVENLNLEKMFKDEIRCFTESVRPITSASGYCRDCKMMIPLENVSDHVLGDKHQSEIKNKTKVFSFMKNPNFCKLMQLWRVGKSEAYVCIACSTATNCLSTTFDHVTCVKHVKKFEIGVKDSELISISNYSINHKSNSLICNVCGIAVENVTNGSWTIQHFSRIVKAVSYHRNVCNTDLKKSPAAETVGDKITFPKTKKKAEKVASVGAKNLSNAVPEKENKPTGGDAGKNANGVVPLQKKRKKKKEMLDEKAVEKESAKKLLFNSIMKLVDTHRPVIISFLCIMCLESDPIDLLNDHLRSENHEKNEAFILSQGKVVHDYCEKCKMLLLGNRSMLQQHNISFYHLAKDGHRSSENLQPKSVIPDTVDVLVIRGLQDVRMPKVKQLLINALQKYGKVKKIVPKNYYIKVYFANPDVVKKIVELKQITVNKLILKVSMRKVTDIMTFQGLKPGIIYLLGHNEHLMNYISSLVDIAFEMKTSVVEREKEEMICKSLKNSIVPLYPNMKCYIFGSRRTGLTLENSDLDVFVDCGNYYVGETNQDALTQGEIVIRVCQALKKSTDFKSIMGIESSRTPIVTCSHVPTNIKCDVSFKNGLSCENTNLIQFMINLDSRITGIILFLKEWIKVHGLYGSPKFSSYALVMLIFYYLQQEPEPILPTVEYLQKKYTGKEKIIAGWNCGFTTNEEDLPKFNNTKSVAELLVGFFNFWTNFDFADNVVCPLTGKPLKRDALRHLHLDALPPPYQKYISNIETKNYHIENSPISIMDPFDLNHNLTKCFPTISLRLFIYLCRVSARLLSNTLASKSFIHLY